MLGGARALGEERGPRVVAALATGVYRVTGVRRDVVRRNLRLAFPERDDAWVRRVARAAFAHIGREAVVAFQSADWDEATLRERVRVEGLDALRAGLAEGKGAVLALGHFGNWELGARVLQVFGIPVAAVVQRQRNPLFDAELNRARLSLGGRVIPRETATRGALRALRDGYAVVFVIDQNAGRHGVFVPFFGVPASTHRGAALMAVRTGAPFFGLRCTRADDGRYDLLLERLDVARDEDPDVAVEHLTADFTKWLENEIRAAPEQYFWLHRRWKTRPREEPGSPKQVLGP